MSRLARANPNGRDLARILDALLPGSTQAPIGSLRSAGEKIMLHVDVPTEADLAALAALRSDACVSIYLPTTPLSQEAAKGRIEIGNLGKEAVRQLEQARIDKRRIALVTEHLEQLADDEEFWRFQAHSLAVFVTPDHLRTFRVANALAPIVAVSDRFHLKPLLRATSFSHVAYVLALAENSVRLIEVSPELPAVIVPVAGMPKDMSSEAHKGRIGDRSSGASLHGGEGNKLRLRHYARKIDQALRGLLAGSGVPLVLAGADPLASVFRSLCTYSHLASAMLPGNPEALSEGEIAQRARAVLDGLHREQLETWTQLFATRESQGRATADVAQVARAATLGAVDSLLVDIDQEIPGTIDEATGELRLVSEASAASYDVLDEIARRVLDTRGRAIGVRKDDIPYGKPLAAILRYPV